MTEPASSFFENSRRLTGPNLYFSDCGTVLDAYGLGAESAQIYQRWAKRIKRLRAALGWADGPVIVHIHATGAALAFTAPQDQLYVATELNEWAFNVEISAWRVAAGLVSNLAAAGKLMDEPSAIEKFRQVAVAEAKPELISLLEAARQHNLPVTVDDTIFSIGAGIGSHSWNVNDLPDVSAVPWKTLHDIPTALVTGSNGKTTTVRLISAMCAASGWTSGYNCTDGAFVGNTCIEAGDFSGPMGARLVLQDLKTQAAVLETARGGLLRRGLAIHHAHAAIVTNISEDHFGEYGVHTLGDLAEVKLVVAKAIGADGVLVLNADDPTLTAKADQLTCALAWFSLDHDHPRLQAHRRAGGSTCGGANGHLQMHHCGATYDLGAIDAMPLTVQGAARYNIANIAGSALVATALGVSVNAIVSVLTQFGTSRRDNPGRLERWEFGKADMNALVVLMDFAHNPDGLSGLLGVALQTRRQGLEQAGASQSSSSRLGLLLSQAGDRDDNALRALARVAAQAKPDQVMLKDMDGALRGRNPGEVPTVLHDELIQCGITDSAIIVARPEVDAALALLEWARPGDILVLPMHTLKSRQQLAASLDSLVATSWIPGNPLPLNR